MSHYRNKSYQLTKLLNYPAHKF